MKLSVRHIAEHVKCDYVGDGDILISGIAPLECAQPDRISFLANPKYERLVDKTGAGCVILSGNAAKNRRGTFLVAANPYYIFALVSQLFHPLPRPDRGISPQAILEKDVHLGEGCSIYPFVYISAGTCIDTGVTIYPHVFLGKHVSIGQDTFIYANVTIRERVSIGKRVIIHPGTVVGSDGYGFATEAGVHYKISQVGNVIIEDDVELGAGVTIDRGSIGSTVIGRGTKFDNQVHVAHNVSIGEHSLLVAQVGIAGSTTIGKHVTIAGRAAVAGHLTIGDYATIAAGSAVIKSVKSRAVVSGLLPARNHQKARRSIASLFRLPVLVSKFNRLERLLRAKGILEKEDLLVSSSSNDETDEKD